MSNTALANNQQNQAQPVVRLTLLDFVQILSLTSDPQVHQEINHEFLPDVFEQIRGTITRCCTLLHKFSVSVRLGASTYTARDAEGEEWVRECIDDMEETIGTLMIYIRYLRQIADFLDSTKSLSNVNQAKLEDIEWLSRDTEEDLSRIKERLEKLEACGGR